MLWNRLSTGLTTGCIVYTNIQPVDKPVWQPVSQPAVSWIQPVVKPIVQPSLTTGWTNSGCSFNSVVKPVVKPVWQSCKRGWTDVVDIFLLGEEAIASPSNGNTLWRVSTTFTRSAITPPDVNGCGWNLEHSEHIVWSWPWQILGAIRAEARAGARAEFLFFLSGK